MDEPRPMLLVREGQAEQTAALQGAHHLEKEIRTLWREVGEMSGGENSITCGCNDRPPDGGAEQDLGIM